MSKIYGMKFAILYFEALLATELEIFLALSPSAL
jgi:hypothetical protein